MAFGHSAAPQVDTLAAQPPAAWGASGGRGEDGQRGSKQGVRRGGRGGPRARGALEDQGFPASALLPRGPVAPPCGHCPVPLCHGETVSGIPGCCPLHASKSPPSSDTRTVPDTVPTWRTAEQVGDGCPQQGRTRGGPEQGQHLAGRPYRGACLRHSPAGLEWEGMREGAVSGSPDPGGPWGFTLRPGAGWGEGEPLGAPTSPQGQCQKGSPRRNAPLLLVILNCSHAQNPTTILTISEGRSVA